MKGAIAVHEAIITVGIVVIGATLLATQVPAMVNGIQDSLSKEAVKEKANELASLLSIASASPGELVITYSLHDEKDYDIAISEGYVTVTSGSDSARAKTLVQFEFQKPNAKSVTITKSSDGVVEVE